MTDLELKCIQSWRETLPDYELKLWNEQSFDYSSYPFAAKAYEFGKFAFVSDVCRLHALYTDGGIYLDTDMFVLKDFDDFLTDKFFIGEEKVGLISAGIIGSEKGNPLVFNLIEKYNQTHFNYDSPLDIPSFLTSYLQRNEIKVYSKEYFYPLPYSERGKDYSPYLNKETHAVHLWNHSWKNEWNYLHDKNFGEAIYQYFKNLASGPFTRRKASFLIQFGKFYFAHLFPGFYWRVKSKEER